MLYKIYLQVKKEQKAIIIDFEIFPSAHTSNVDPIYDHEDHEVDEIKAFSLD